MSESTPLNKTSEIKREYDSMSEDEWPPCSTTEELFCELAREWLDNNATAILVKMVTPQAPKKASMKRGAASKCLNS